MKHVNPDRTKRGLEAAWYRHVRFRLSNFRRSKVSTESASPSLAKSRGVEAFEVTNGHFGGDYMPVFSSSSMVSRAVLEVPGRET